MPADASKRQLLPANSKAVSKTGCNSLKLKELVPKKGFPYIYFELIDNTNSIGI
jgi:hypothetical protein